MQNKIWASQIEFWAVECAHCLMNQPMWKVTVTKGVCVTVQCPLLMTGDIAPICKTFLLNSLYFNCFCSPHSFGGIPVAFLNSFSPFAACSLSVRCQSVTVASSTEHCFIHSLMSLFALLLQLCTSHSLTCRGPSFNFRLDSIYIFFCWVNSFISNASNGGSNSSSSDRREESVWQI